MTLVDAVQDARVPPHPGVRAGRDALGVRARRRCREISLNRQRARGAHGHGQRARSRRAAAQIPLVAAELSRSDVGACPSTGTCRARTVRAARVPLPNVTLRRGNRQQVQACGPSLALPAGAQKRRDRAGKKQQPCPWSKMATTISRAISGGHPRARDRVQGRLTTLRRSGRTRGGRERRSRTPSRQLTTGGSCQMPGSRTSRIDCPP